ncbi:MAG TPA: hypothetical protein VGU46_09615 [Acidobacteriaceae bacterium]|nr:hypothetical protein [Acidobacteriaceae bacterium]
MLRLLAVMLAVVCLISHPMSLTAQNSSSSTAAPLSVDGPAFVVIGSTVRTSNTQEPPASALQVALVRYDAAQAARPLFKIELRNKTNGPLVLDLGTNIGGKEYTEKITFSLTDQQGRMRRLVKKIPPIHGTAWPYIITIREGGTFELPAIDLADYFSYEPKIEPLILPAGRYSLTTEYTGHNPTNHPSPAPGQPPDQQYIPTFRNEAVRSNILEFTLTSPIGDPHASEAPVEIVPSSN